MCVCAFGTKFNYFRTTLNVTQTILRPTNVKKLKYSLLAALVVVRNVV